MGRSSGTPYRWLASGADLAILQVRASREKEVGGKIISI